MLSCGHIIEQKSLWRTLSLISTVLVTNNFKDESQVEKEACSPTQTQEEKD